MDHYEHQLAQLDKQIAKLGVSSTRNAERAAKCGEALKDAKQCVSEGVIPYIVREPLYWVEKKSEGFLTFPWIHD